jgi:UDP-GlcNAc:undecaprenyl-phosphate/decaprenyl-phosphate GlcNAc-1-phosphate transferase
VSGLAAIAALPAAAAVIWTILRTNLGARVVAHPSGDRWHERSTPTLGGVGIFAGILAGVGGALAAGVVEPSTELLGILAGAAILFAAGLLDDLFSLGPLAKIGAQLTAAAVVLSTALSVQLVENRVLAAAIGVVWLVGMTNAFNLLDNMDGLAATLACIAALFFAVDALTLHPSDIVLVLALSVALACAGFLPFNVRLRSPARIFMGDSGSQVLGFTLASLGLASSWKVAGSTFATILLPVLILAVPILDTALVTVVRLLEGRPVHRGGRDHTSHRLVYRGLSEKRALVLLATIAAAVGATSIAYNVLDNARITTLGVLLTFAMLVQFASFLADVERRAPAAAAPRSPLRFLVPSPRRLIEVFVDFALVSAAFLAAYLLIVGGDGTVYQRHIFLASLPILLAARYLTFIPFGLYKGVWRYAGARDAASVVAAVAISGILAYAFVELTRDFRDFPRSVFVLDALLCALFIGGARFGERAIDRGLASLHSRGRRRRTLIVGAGRGGRSLLRELRETPGEKVIGFLDDDPRLRGRRLQGVPVLGTCEAVGRALAATAPDAVLVTIPAAPRERLQLVVTACEAAQVPCRFVRRDLDLDPRVILGAAAK